MDLKTFINKKVIIICIVLCFTINKCLSITKILSVENDRVCSPIKKRHIHLNNYEPPSVVVTETRYFDTWLGDKEFLCKFKVEANSDPRFSFTYVHEPEGVFAVVQNFTLRMNDDGRCIDYIQFIQDSKLESRKICGKRSDLTRISDQLSYFAPNAYLDPSGHLDVVIYIARQKLAPGERIDFSIVFTSYKECSSRMPHLQSCKSGGDMDSAENGHKYCIAKELFYNGLVNCPFPGCKDEGGCKSWDRNMPFPIDDQPGTAATTLGALAVVVLVFACFLSALWILRKLHILCWSAPQAAAAPPPSPPPAVYFSEGAVHEMLPSAPPLHSPDKDPPPSYTSLFPPKPDES